MEHPFPLEAEEGGGRSCHFYMMVRTGDFHSAVVLAALEQLMALALQCLHPEVAPAQVPIHLAAVHR